MRWRTLTLFLLVLVARSLVAQQLPEQPQRLHYFPDSGRGYGVLDPGQEILQRNLLISNQASANNVSFSLSFNKEGWNRFGLGPRFSSIFNLDGQEGCYIRVRTRWGQEAHQVREVVYFLIRGKCYSVYWNTQLSRWDIVENPCR
ncbi:MAG: hypothetical protein AAGJ82_08915 [Bacteroidota bacterium]